MTDELELDLDTQESNEEIISRKDKRYNNLASKFGESEKERESLAKAKEEAEAKAQAAQKEAEFFKNFNTVSTKFPGAGEYQEKIREKAALGLTVEEATTLVMASEGKYVPPAPTQERIVAGGGSAATAMSGADGKSPQEMTQAERFAALSDLDARGELRI